ncbi:hypothetical protein ETD83_29500 [Actinomadura soli]|uniref:Uncharacterized protein n=1 Tax=Actinomadura soli TaxID=2508997 RepID=A0A5C4J4C8_9ACTN|nr:hypothetical protein [Actinomadura soli]TMQ91740.1 hypothetical protein ETD83_29500 [Actinomadura soli]
MGKRKRHNRPRREERRFRVRGVRRDPPDMRKLGKALISLAQAEAERQAQVEHDARRGHDEEERVEHPQSGREGNDE